MSDDVYTKQLEDENEKLRQQLADVQEKFDLVEAKNKSATDTDSTIYKPIETEIVDGYQLHEIAESPWGNAAFITCVKIKKGWFGKINKDYWSFTAICKPNGKGFNTSYYAYPSNKDLDTYATKENNALANYMYNIARQQNFIVVTHDANGGLICLPYGIAKDKKKRQLKNGHIKLEP